jgi:hypothetical protein
MPPISLVSRNGYPQFPAICSALNFSSGDLLDCHGKQLIHFLVYLAVWYFESGIIEVGAYRNLHYDLNQWKGYSR